MKDRRLQLAIMQDKKGKLLFDAIQNDVNDEGVEVRRLLRAGAKGGGIYQNKNCLQYAASLGRWCCTLAIIENLPLRSSNFRHHFVHRAGQVLLQAAKENQQQVVDALIEQFTRTFVQFGTWMKGDKRVIYRNWHGLWKDKENGYTALHWAVHHNNPGMCELFLIFCPGLCEHGDSHIYRAKNKERKTAFELAVEKGYWDCAKAVGAGMSLFFAANHTSDDTLRKICFEKMDFHSSSILIWPVTKSTREKKKKILYECFLDLDLPAKRQALDLVDEYGTLAYFLVHQVSDYKQFMGKLLQILVDEEEAAKNQQTQTQPFISSDSLIRKRLPKQSVSFDRKDDKDDESMSISSKNKFDNPSLEIKEKFENTSYQALMCRKL